MTQYRIPLRSGPQKMRAFLGDRFFTLSILYRDAEIGGSWYMDMTSADGVALNGLPLIVGVDLLAQFQHMGWGHLWVQVDAGERDLSTYAGLDNDVSLIWSGDE